MENTLFIEKHTGPTYKKNPTSKIAFNKKTNL